MAGRAVTTVAVEPSEEVFAGHYPGFPIFPGVCVVECVHRGVLATAEAPVTLTAVESTRFVSPVFPGDELTIEITSSWQDSTLRCRAVVSTARGRAAAVRLRYRTGEPDDRR